MNTIGNIRLTPEKVVSKSLYFGIPIYQRLFTWTEKQVERLMCDLYEHYINNSKANVPYFIGALSCVCQNNRYDLIDGQQRMTAMALIGIAFNSYGHATHWENFLAKGERIHFVARSSDAAYFKERILGQTNFTNQNQLMEEGIDTIHKFLCKTFGSELEIKKFGNWIFKNLSFFISALPESYAGNKHLLNKYFENMNASGKGLEQHDILKVQLIRGRQNQEYLTKIWNIACDFSQNIIKSKSDESNSEYASRYASAIKYCRNGDFAKALSMCISSYDDDEDRTLIGEIEPIPYEHESYYRPTDNRGSLLSLPEFLLMVLDLQNYDGGLIRNKESFYNQPLLKAFASDTIAHLNVNQFYEDLLFYRLLLDYYFITLSREDINLNYELILHSNDREKTACCRQFEAMLYVSDTPIYHWITPMLHSLKVNGDTDAEGLLRLLKEYDRNFRGRVEQSELMFPEAKVYWFRRLEYLIWENRRYLFKEDDHSLEVAENYRFVSNRRSREHIVPQTPKSESNLTWKNDPTDADIMNSFGNLVLISASLNSKLSNESYEIKKAYVSSYQNRSMGGSIESLSLLLFHTRHPKLTPETMRDIIKNYGDFTYEILSKSF